MPDSNFGLPEKGEFSRDKLEKELTGKIVAVRGAADFSIYGKLVYYQSGDIAVLKPYVFYIGSNIESIDKKAIVERPVVISQFGYNTVEELIEKYLKPVMEEQKKVRAESQK